MIAYCTVEDVKARLEVKGADKDVPVFESIKGATLKINNELRRRFIPITKTNYYEPPGSAELRLKDDLLSVTTLTSENGTETIDDADYLLEPINEGPPYSRLVINTASANNVSFAMSTSGPKGRANAVTGSWGYSEDTATAGTVASGLASSASATSCVCSDSSLIGVGTTLLCESEQLFVTAKTANDLGKNTAGALTAAMNDVTLAVEASHGLIAGEVILVDSEKLYIQAISGNNLTMIRAYDATKLAAHNSGADVYVFRTLTVVRGVNGTTADTHANGTALSKYAPPDDIVALCRAEAIWMYEQDESGQTGMVGSGDGATNVRPTALRMMWDAAYRKYGRVPPV